MGKKKILDIFAEETDLPSEVVYDLPFIELTGDRGVTVENYRGIISYEGEEVKINTATSIIQIKGHKLELSHITDELISVSGEIKALQFI